MYWQGIVHYRDGHVEKSDPTDVTWYVGTDSDVGLPDGTTQHSPITKPVTSDGVGGPVVDDYDPLAFNPTKPGEYQQPFDCSFLSAEKPITMAGSWDGSLKSSGSPANVGLDYTVGGEPYTESRSVVEVPETMRSTMPAAGDLNNVIAAGEQVYAVPAANFSWDTTKVKFEGVLETQEEVNSADMGRDAHFVAGYQKDGAWILTGQQEPSPVMRQNAPERHNEQIFFDRPGYYALTYAFTVVRSQENGDGHHLQGYRMLTVWYAVGQKAIDNACQRSGASPSPSPSPSPFPAPTPDPSPAPTPDPTASPSTAPKPAQLVLDSGHSDIFFVAPKGDGKLNLDLREDVTGYHVHRDPADVDLVVKPTARRQLPADVSSALLSDAGQGASPAASSPMTAYVLPQTQDPNLLWPGWETTEVRNAGINEVKLNIRVDGPGKVYVFQMGGLGGMKSVLENGGYTLDGTIVAPFPAHTHANWAFTQPGGYTFHVQATAMQNGQPVSSDVKDYHWSVGEGDAVSGEPTTVSEPKPVANGGTGSPSPDVPSGANHRVGAMGHRGSAPKVDCRPTKIKVTASARTEETTIVGRTPGGAECRLSDTGAPAHVVELLGLAALSIMVGGVLVSRAPR